MYIKIKKDTGKKLKEILTNKNEFIKFIKFYSNFYKYKFQDALCIYVQNENVTAVAEYDTWQRIKYQVKKGERGIGLFDDSKFSKLRYVFDVSSTYQQKIKLWEYIEDKHKNILDLDFSKDKFIEKYSIENIEDESIKNLIYCMNKLAKNTRLGIEIENFDKIIEKALPKIQLEDIDIFFDKLCSTISQDLREIENTIKSYERNLLKEKEQKSVPFSNDKNNENISIESKKEYIKQYFG
ncbi:MAG: ssDNA-binding domain-containing protein, partial [Eubacteriales bacterium]|nr:ssDNA-binding domain-containing protein [Eubacteriales bacterium]